MTGRSTNSWPKVQGLIGWMETCSCGIVLVGEGIVHVQTLDCISFVDCL